jgi:hypothetical protein
MVITNLAERIKALYPELTWDDFRVNIVVRNDSDGNGDYIKEWNHPTLPRPTEEQLA